MIKPLGRENSIFKYSGTGKSRLSGRLEDKEEVLGECCIEEGLHGGHRQSERSRGWQPCAGPEPGRPTEEFWSSVQEK